MKFLFLLTGWSTLTFGCMWLLAPPYRHVMTKVVERIVTPLVVPPGFRGHYVMFYPFDVGLYVALCLASTWVPFARRLRVIAIGFPVIVVLELLCVAIMMRLTAVPQSSPRVAVEAERVLDGLIRVGDLVMPAGLWVVFLGRKLLSPTARTRRTP